MSFLSVKSPPARGVDLIAPSLAIPVVFAVMVAGFYFWHDFSQMREYETVAGQATRYASAARHYISANYDSLLDSAPTTISHDTLVNSGYLNSGESETNLYQQTWHVAVKPSDNNSDVLEGLLLSTGGLSLEYKALRYISAAVDSGGGFVYSGAMPDGCNKTVSIINGASCSWTLNVSGFGLSTTSGHLAVNLNGEQLGSISQGADFLHRYSTTGHEEYNQMQTALDMNSNNVNKAGNLLVTSNGSTTDNHATSGSSGFFGWTPAGTDGTGTDASQLTAGFYYAPGVTGEKENTWIKTTDDTSLAVDGKIKADVVKGDTLLNAGKYTMPGSIVKEGNSCDVTTLGLTDQLSSTSGLMAPDADGALLTCQNGVWTSISKRTPKITEFNVDANDSIQNAGTHDFCTISYIHNLEDSHYCTLSSAENGDGTYNWSVIGHKGGCYLKCLDYE